VHLQLAEAVKEGKYDVLLGEEFLAVLASEDKVVLQQVLAVAGVVVLVRLLRHDCLWFGTMRRLHFSKEWAAVKIGAGRLDTV
jgi:hypothetical protein